MTSLISFALAIDTILSNVHKIIYQVPRNTNFLLILSLSINKDLANERGQPIAMHLGLSVPQTRISNTNYGPTSFELLSDQLVESVNNKSPAKEAQQARFQTVIVQAGPKLLSPTKTSSLFDVANKATTEDKEHANRLYNRYM